MALPSAPQRAKQRLPPYTFNSRFRTARVKSVTTSSSAAEAKRSIGWTTGPFVARLADLPLAKLGSRGVRLFFIACAYAFAANSPANVRSWADRLFYSPLTVLRSWSSPAGSVGIEGTYVDVASKQVEQAGGRTLVDINDTVQATEKWRSGIA